MTPSAKCTTSSGAGLGVWWKRSTSCPVFKRSGSDGGPVWRAAAPPPAGPDIHGHRSLLSCAATVAPALLTRACSVVKGTLVAVDEALCAIFGAPFRGMGGMATSSESDFIGSDGCVCVSVKSLNSTLLSVSAACAASPAGSSALGIGVAARCRGLPGNDCTGGGSLAGSSGETEVAAAADLSQALITVTTPSPACCVSRSHCVPFSLAPALLSTSPLARLAA